MSLMPLNACSHFLKEMPLSQIQIAGHLEILSSGTGIISFVIVTAGLIIIIL